MHDSTLQVASRAALPGCPRALVRLRRSFMLPTWRLWSNGVTVAVEAADPQVVAPYVSHGVAPHRDTGCYAPGAIRRTETSTRRLAGHDRERPSL